MDYTERPFKFVLLVLPVRRYFKTFSLSPTKLLLSLVFALAVHNIYFIYIYNCFKNKMDTMICN